MPLDSTSDNTANDRPALGVCQWFHYEDHDMVRRAVARMRELGVRHLRTGVSWADFHRPAGEAWYAWMFDQLAEFDLLVSVWHTPPSLAENEQCNGAPRRLRDYADFIWQLDDLFGDRFDTFELWNEPNNRYKWDFRHCDPQWRKFSRMIAMAGRTAHLSGKRTVLGGMIPVDPAWLRLIDEQGGLNDIDVIAIHGFPHMWWHGDICWEWRRDWRGWAEKVEKIASISDGRPIWVTETGLATWDLNRGHRSREELQSQMLTQAAAAPCERVYWYSLIDLAPQRTAIEGFHVDENEYHMGLVTHDGDRKPAYARMKRLLREGEQAAGESASRDAGSRDAGSRARGQRQRGRTGGRRLVGVRQPQVAGVPRRGRRLSVSARDAGLVPADAVVPPHGRAHAGGDRAGARRLARLARGLQGSASSRRRRSRHRPNDRPAHATREQDGGMMRVLMTADTIGGVWTYALDLCRELCARGVTVRLVTMGRVLSATQRDSVDAIDGLTVRETELRLEWMSDPWDDVNEAGDVLLREARTFQPDVVHLNNFAHGVSPFDCPVLLVGHSCVDTWWRAVKGAATDDGWARYRDVVREGIHAADAFVAPTAAIGRAFARSHGEHRRALTIHNGRSASGFQPASKQPYVLSAGRLWDEAKNLRALDEAAARIDWPVRVAGAEQSPDGDDGHAARHAGRHVQPLGRLAPAQLASRMSRAAIYALPARYEPFGLSALEAALSGCALVLGGIDTLREVWADAATFVPPDDANALAAAINALIRDGPRRRRMQQAAQQRAARYRADRMADEYLRLYRQLVNAPNAPNARNRTDQGNHAHHTNPESASCESHCSTTHSSATGTTVTRTFSAV